MSGFTPGCIFPVDVVEVVAVDTRLAMGLYGTVILCAGEGPVE
jgi:hypothetical protein